MLNSDQTIVHLILLKLADGVDSELSHSLTQSIQRAAKASEGCRDIKVGFDLGLGDEVWSVAVALEFENVSAFHDYLGSTEHQSISQRFGDYIERKASSQFEVLS